MLDHAIAFMTGFLVFFATGIDDILVVFNLMQGKVTRKKIAIYAGTLVGTFFMFCVCIFLTSVAKEYINNLEQFFKALCLIPLLYGVKIAKDGIKGPKAEDHENKKKEYTTIMYFVLACIIYITNMADDVTINSAILFGLNGTSLIITMMIGNFLSCLTMLILADYGTRGIQNPKIIRLIQVISGTTIIILAIRFMFK